MNRERIGQIIQDNCFSQDNELYNTEEAADQILAELAKEREGEVRTSELIYELEKRRPCKECDSWQHNATPCMSCFWKGLWDMGASLDTDNFKPKEAR